MREKDAGVAQLVEHVIRNDGVVGSSPITGTIALRKTKLTPCSVPARRFSSR